MGNNIIVKPFPIEPLPDSLFEEIAANQAAISRAFHANLVESLAGKMIVDPEPVGRTLREVEAVNRYTPHPRAVEAVHEVIDELIVVDLQWRKP